MYYRMLPALVMVIVGCCLIWALVSAFSGPRIGFGGFSPFFFGPGWYHDGGYRGGGYYGGGYSGPSPSSPSGGYRGGGTTGGHGGK